MKKTRNSKIDEDPDYIDSPKYDFSLKKFLSSNPNGVSDKIIAKVLKLKTDDIDKLYACAIIKLRKALEEDDKI